MYPFQASDPDSRPPPVSFSPPNAPPISAPLVPMLTLAMPQSLPRWERNRSAPRTLGPLDRPPPVPPLPAFGLEPLDGPLQVRDGLSRHQRPHQRARIAG